MSDYFMARLSQMEFKHPATVRIKALTIGIDPGDADYASKIVDKCRRAGLLLTDEDEALAMFPALNIDSKVAREGLDILWYSVSEVRILSPGSSITFNLDFLMTKI